MIETDTDKAFLGVGWSFLPGFYRHAGGIGVQMVNEEDDIRESLKILLSTRPGERIMQPDYGCRLHAMVFDIISESAMTEIKDVIDRAILFFESRITLNSIDVDTEEIYDGILKIKLDYTVRKTNTRSNVVYPFYYIEGNQVSV